MSFETPLMLLGLLAVALPIFLHLRRTVKTRIPFPAMGVLAEVARQKRKSINLMQKILLATRIAFIVAVVLAIAKPGITVTRKGGVRSGPALGLAVVIDDSFSMQASGGDGRAFTAAKELALTEIGRLRPGDGAALILSGEPVRVLTPSIEFNIRDVRRQIENLQPGFGTGDLGEAVRKASNVLLSSSLPAREVLVITDLANDTIKGDARMWPEGEDISLRIIDATRGEGRDNVAVDSVRVSPSPSGEAKEAHIEARLSNYSGALKANLAVVLEVEGAEVARGSVDIEPGESVLKGFYHRFKSDGVHRGHIRIESNGSDGDDTRHFAVSIRQSITALIVDGDYRPGSYRDEAFYLRKALETPMPSLVPIRPVVVDLNAAASGPLTGKDIVFLAGVGEVSGSFAARLTSYVKAGGGLFISPGTGGTKWDAIEPILPAKVRSIRQTSRPQGRFRIAAINRSHPVFQPFKSNPTGLEKTQIRAHLLFEPKPDTEKKTLIELANGLPLLLERSVEMGKVMVLATTVDRDWTDLPIRPGYFPLIQRSARYLSGRLRDKAAMRIFVGGAVPIEVTEGMQRLLVRAPDGTDTVYSAADLSEETAVLFDRTSVPGHYRVWAEIPTFGGLKELDTHGFVVEIDPRESDLRKREMPAEENSDVALAPIKGSLPVWPYLLTAALLLLFLETWLSNRGLRAAHVGSASRTRKPETQG